MEWHSSFIDPDPVHICECNVIYGLTREGNFKLTFVLPRRRRGDQGRF